MATTVFAIETMATAEVAPKESTLWVTEAATPTTPKVSRTANRPSYLASSLFFLTCVFHSSSAALVATPFCASAICLQTTFSVFARSSASLTSSGGFLS